MNRLGVGAPGGIDDTFDSQIGIPGRGLANGDRLVGHRNVHGVGIRL